jgi:hypothetical protein
MPQSENEATTCQQKKRSRVDGDDDDDKVVGTAEQMLASAKKLGAYTAVLLAVLFPLNGDRVHDETNASRKYAVCRDLCDVLRQVHSNAAASRGGEEEEGQDAFSVDYYADPQLVNVNQLPKWMKDLKTSLDREDRQKDMTANKVVEKFFCELKVLSDLLIIFGRGNLFQRNFCLDRLCNMAYTVVHFSSSSIASEATNLYRDAYREWSNGKEEDVKEVLKRGRYVKPVACSAWF